jgi:hypothetical protein
MSFLESKGITAAEWSGVYPQQLQVQTTPRLASVGVTKRRVPHISLVFCEMWDTTNLN